MTDFEMKDSGQREEFTTGAVRDSREGKGRYDLIPVIALKRVAAVYEKGASKYTARNWEGGINQSRCYDSALRHLMQYAEGLRDEDHLAQAAFNVLAMIFTEEQVNRGNLPASLMDLPSYVELNVSSAMCSSCPGYNENCNCNEKVAASDKTWIQEAQERAQRNLDALPDSLKRSTYRDDMQAIKEHLRIHRTDLGGHYDGTDK